ncbi:MAG TPA: hypothetical protein VL404_07770 [Candidatus Eisenbacteria bacterium]|jgi:hypothetical protein|nr:hypothetical protein [Candidatus Eisenbacteria bacterium]
MRFVGILVVLAGWVVTMAGLIATTSTLSRGLFACAGIAVSLFGIFGILNQYYLGRALWKK